MLVLTGALHRSPCPTQRRAAKWPRSRQWRFRVKRMEAHVSCCAMQKRPVHTLVSFDVDGTLVESIASSASKLHRNAFSHCFKTHYDLDTDIDAIQHQGSTDPLIILAVLAAHGIDPKPAMKQMPELMQTMIDHFMKNVDDAGAGLRVLPGVASLLAHLKERGDVATCLVTGNLQPIGWGKMQALGIHHLFTPSAFGGFGSDYCSGNYWESWRDRAELIRIAGKKAESLTGDGISRSFHIGDAPMDMMAAKEAGVTGIGVTTGVYSQKTLMEAGAAIVIENLENLNEVLSILKLV